MKNTQQTPAQKTYKAIVRAGVLEDRREYDITDLQMSYPDMSEADITELFNLIQANF